MSVVETLLSRPAAQAIGWALLHFVWQGALIGILTSVVLTLLRRSAADVRYVVSTIALSLMFTMPVVTGLQLWRAVPAASDATVETPLQVVPDRSAAHDASTRTVAIDRGVTAALPPAGERTAGFDSWLPTLVMGWLCGVGALTLRLMSGWLWVQRMKARGTSPAAEGWQLIAARLSKRLHIARPVRLLQSTLVDVPTVIGWFKPVVLLPASTLSGLAPELLEAILAHELAHVRRHDYLVNLLQALVETLLFYHPAVWWLSRRIRAERENCCDDLAVSLCGDAITYARALADLEDLRGTGGRLVMAANGGSLVQRISRLLGAPTHAGRSPGWLAGGAAVILMSGIAAGAAGMDVLQWPIGGSVVTASGSTAVVMAEAAVLPRDEELMARSQSATAAPARPQDPTPAIARTATSAPKVPAVPAVATTPRVASTAEAAVTAQAAATPPVATTPQVASVPQVATVPASPATPATAVEPASTMSKVFGAVAGSIRSGGQTHRTFSWSNNGEKLEVRYDGEAEFSDDDTDVKRLSPGGLLKIKDGWMFPSHTIEFSADGDGNIKRRYWSGMSERPFDPEGRQWLAGMLPHFIRQTGIGAPARVRRILAAKGPAGVLAEIALIEGSYGKKVYFTELLKTASLDPATVRQILAQASREVDSDFELASLLIDCADKLMVDEATRQAYFEAARTIESDFEMRRVYTSAVKRGALGPPALAALLDASRKINSDFEEASLLIDVAKWQALDSTTRTPFFSALATVESDFEHRRVLTALATRQDLSPETTAAMLGSIASVQSDFEAASFLVDVASRQSIDGAARAPFFRAVDTIGSAFERGRVLKAVVGRPDASSDTILAALHAAAGMDSGFERSNVLLAIANTHTLDGQARDAYIAAAEKLGDFEQGKVMTALVKNERRK
jgi:beta-lactamase regulating signal transducer with metallopeptidase domain